MSTLNATRRLLASLLGAVTRIGCRVARKPEQSDADSLYRAPATPNRERVQTATRTARTPLTRRLLLREACAVKMDPVSLRARQDQRRAAIHRLGTGCRVECDPDVKPSEALPKQIVIGERL